MTVADQVPRNAANTRHVDTVHSAIRSVKFKFKSSDSSS